GRARTLRRALRQLPRPRRADEPPRPRGDRAARARARLLRRLPRRRQPRPALPRARPPDSYDRAVRVEQMRAADWPAVARIYEHGLDAGTFEDSVPSWERWDATHLDAGRLVARDGDGVVGWAALAPASDPACYAGVVEDSVYVARDARGRGVGRLL